jgi:TPR repeat protein
VKFVKSVLGFALSLLFCFDLGAMKRPAPKGPEINEVKGSQVTKRIKVADVSESSASNDSSFKSFLPGYMRPILCHILKNLPPKDLLNFSNICKQTNFIVKNGCNFQTDLQLELTDVLWNNLLLQKFIRDRKQVINGKETGKFLLIFLTKILRALFNNFVVFGARHNQAVINAIIEKVIDPIFLCRFKPSQEPALADCTPEENFWFGVKKLFGIFDNFNNDMDEIVRQQQFVAQALQHFKAVEADVFAMQEDPWLCYAKDFFVHLGDAGSYDGLSLPLLKNEFVAKSNPFIYIKNLCFYIDNIMSVDTNIMSVNTKKIEKIEENLNAVIKYPNVKEIDLQSWIAANFGLGFIYNKKKEYQKALPYLAEVTKCAQAQQIGLLKLVKAHYLLSEIYYWGYLGSKDDIKALSHYNEIISLCSEQILNIPVPAFVADYITVWLKTNSRLGEFFYYGYGVEKNHQKAQEYYSKIIGHPRAHELADAEFLDAHCMVGEILTAAGNFQEAITHYVAIVNSASSKEHNIKAWLTAHNRLGDFYHNGCGVEKNDQEAKSHYKNFTDNISAVNPDPSWAEINAYYMLEEISYLGSRDWIEIALHCHMILRMDERGEKHFKAWIKAHSRLGECFSIPSLGTVSHDEESIKHFLQIVNHPKAKEECFGDWLNAHYMLAKLYSRDLNKNEKEASKHFQVIYKLSPDKQKCLKWWLEIQTLLGELYYFGCGVKENFEKAFKLFESVKKETQAQNVNLSAFLRAIAMLGSMYFFGDGVTENHQEALKYCKFVAEHSKAQQEETLRFWLVANAILGAIYQLDYGFEDNALVALNYCKVVVEHPKAQQACLWAWLFANKRLGDIHSEAESELEKNEQEALKYYKVVVEHPKARQIDLSLWLEANFRLGEMYFNVDFVKDDRKALECLKAVVNTLEAEEIAPDEYEQAKIYIDKIEKK